jgi:PAS domain S-box-containing protein/putative nucleotidyltransferase with HDIG domain
MAMTPLDGQSAAAAILDGLFETAGEGIVLLDDQNRILRVNAEFLSMFGYEEFEVLGSDLDDLVVVPENRAQARDCTRRTWKGEKVFVEAVRNRKDGTPVVVSILSFPIRISGRSIVFGAIYRDISRSRALENSLRTLLDLEHEVAAVCREFIAESDFEKAVHFALARIGRLFEADEAFFHRWTNPDGRVDGASIWLREGRVPGKPVSQDLNIRDFPWWFGRLNIGDIFKISDPGLLPPEASAEKALLMGDSAFDVLVFPVRLENRPTGFIGVVNAKRSCLDDESSRRLLNIVAQVVGAALGRKRSEDALRESTRRYEALFDRSNDAVFILDLQGRHLAVNDRGVALLGYARHEIIGSDIRLTVDLAEQGAARERLMSLESGKILPIYERTFRRKDGTPLPVEINVALVRDEAGHPLHIQSIVRDISERKKTETTLRESEEKYRRLIDRANDGIIIIRAGRLVFSNSRFRALSGFDGAAFQDIALEDLLHPDEKNRVMENYRRRLSGEIVPSIYETVFRKADGTDLPVELNAGLIQYEDGPADLVFVRDVSDRKQTSERLIRAMKSSIAAMAAAMEKRDAYTAGHQNRVTELALAVAREMNLDAHRREGLQIAGLIHDIGKLSIPSEILSKPGRLTELEFRLIQTHPEAGYDILKSIEFPWPVADIVLQHHEKIDGSGYPRGLRGDTILLESRILSVADVVEAMSTHRPYRPSLGLEAAIAEIECGRGTYFDPLVVDACVRVLRREENRTLLAAE